MRVVKKKLSFKIYNFVCDGCCGFFFPHATRSCVSVDIICMTYVNVSKNMNIVQICFFAICVRTRTRNIERTLIYAHFGRKINVKKSLVMYLKLLKCCYFICYVCESVCVFATASFCINIHFVEISSFSSSSSCVSFRWWHEITRDSCK